MGLSGYWSLRTDELLQELRITSAGLTAGEAVDHLQEHGPNRIHPKEQASALQLFLNQFRSPIVLRNTLLSFFQKHNNQYRL